MYKAVLLLFTVFVLVGCAQRAQGAAPSNGAGGTAIAVESSRAAAGTNDKGAGDTEGPNTAAITLTPATGYAGTFVGVTGSGWPPSVMVLVKLADAQGRSPVLAAVAADAKGQFTTGFVYPVGDRWLQPGSAAVVAHTENGQVESAASFTIAPPAGVLPLTSTPTAPPAASPTAVLAVALPITATIPFTSGALAATSAPTVTPVPTATPLPTATPVSTALPSATAASTPTIAPTATATAAPPTDKSAYSAPASTIDELIAAIRSMPSGDLAPELANSLVQKLNNAQKQVDKGHATPAANMLRAFQHEVAAQWGKKIDDAAATFLNDSADNVVTHLQGQPAENGSGSDSGSDNGRGSDKEKGSDKGSDKHNGNGKGNGNGNGNGKGNGKGKGHG